MEALTRRFPGVAVMLLSGAGDDDQIMAGIRHGVSAYITSDIGLRPTVRAIRLMRQGLMIYPHHMLQTLGQYGAAPFHYASHSGARSYGRPVGKQYVRPFRILGARVP